MSQDDETVDIVQRNTISTHVAAIQAFAVQDVLVDTPASQPMPQVNAQQGFLLYRFGRAQDFSWKLARLIVPSGWHVASCNCHDSTEIFDCGAQGILLTLSSECGTFLCWHNQIHSTISQGCVQDIQSGSGAVSSCSFLFNLSTLPTFQQQGCVELMYHHCVRATPTALLDRFADASTH